MPSRMVFLGFSALLGTLGGCAAPQNTGAGVPSFPAQTPAQGVASPGAGWLQLGSHGESTVFLHPHSTLRVGSSAFIMVVVAARRPTTLPGGLTLGSLRERIEIDCEKSRFRRHDGTVHPDQAGSGPVVARVGQDQWKDVTPNSVIAVVSRAVCSEASPSIPPMPGAPGQNPSPSLPQIQKKRGGTFST